MRKLIIAIGTITMVVVIIFSPLLYYVFNINYYLSLYEKNKVFEFVDRQDAIRLTEGLIGFLKDKEDFKPFILKNNLSYFTTDEISHLGDVRILFNKIFLTYYICLGLTLIFIAVLFEKNIKNYLKNISVLLMLPSAILISLLLILYFFGQNFMPLFDKFHLIFFPQGNFAFPEDSTLITLLPLNFFNDFFTRLVTASLLFAAVLIITGAVIFIISKKFLKDRKLDDVPGRI
ncbi:MAG: lipoprotein intramolecular transacylase Lit [Candidatus Humimicrobiaceae bacterium]